MNAKEVQEANIIIGSYLNVKQALECLSEAMSKTEEDYSINCEIYDAENFGSSFYCLIDTELKKDVKKLLEKQLEINTKKLTTLGVNIESIDELDNEEIINPLETDELCL